MSPVQHPISGPALALDLAEELRVVHEQLATTSRTARTLVKNGALRVTLMGIAAGGALASHSADGPITVHVLEGTIEFEAEGKTLMLQTRFNGYHAEVALSGADALTPALALCAAALRARAA